MNRIVFIIIAILFITACGKNADDIVEINGYKPIYISKENAKIIKYIGPQTLVTPGKMYLYNNYIYIIDFGSGVHIIDNSDPSKPNKLGFISIPGVNDVAVKDEVLLADNFTDLVAIDISDLSNIKLTNRVKNIYPVQNQYYPEFATGYFECTDASKGYILKWEKAKLKSPKCYR